MNDENSKNDVSETPPKPKSNRNKIIIGVVGLVVICCCLALAIGASGDKAEDDEATATVEIQEQDAASEETDSTDVEEIVEVEPTSTSLPADTPEPKKTTVPTDTPTPTNTPEPSSQYLGDINEEYGYFLTGLSIEDPATPGSFYDPVEGQKLVAIEVVVGNISGEFISTNPLDFTLVDDDGFTYRTELGGRDGGQIALVDLNQGEKVRGWIAFSIPVESTPAKIKYEIGIFSDEVLQASLEEPPNNYEVDNEILSTTPTTSFPNLGEVAEQHDYSLSGVTVEDPTNSSWMYDPIDGYKLVAVEIVVGNVSGEILSINPLDVFLVDNYGYVYDAELGGREDSGQIELVDLAEGERVKGWVSFSIPENATPSSVKYQISFFSDEYVQTGLSQP